MKAISGVFEEVTMCACRGKDLLPHRSNMLEGLNGVIGNFTQKLFNEPTGWYSTAGAVL